MKKINKGTECSNKDKIKENQPITVMKRPIKYLKLVCCILILCEMKNKDKEDKINVILLKKA